MCNKWEKISHSHTNHIYTEVKYLVVYLVYIKDTKIVSQSLIRFVHLFLLKEASLLKTFCPMSRWDQNKILQQAVSVACNWSLTTLWLIDELSQSVPAYKHASSQSKKSVSKACGHVVFENNRKALWGCADQNTTLNSWGVVYFTCLSGWSYLSPSKRSKVYKYHICIVSFVGPVTEETDSQGMPCLNLWLTHMCS